MAFFKSMANSFSESTIFISQNGLFPQFKERVLKVYSSVEVENWLHLDTFSKALDILDD